MVIFINDYMFDFSAVYPIDVTNRPRTKEIRGNIRIYRKDLAQMKIFIKKCGEITKCFKRIAIVWLRCIGQRIKSSD